MSNTEFPTRYEGRAAWTGEQMRASNEWHYRFSQADLAELHAAYEAVSHLPIPQITRTNFVLPTLETRFDAMRQDLVSGRGFLLLQGLDIEDASIEKSAALYWAIGLYFGTPVSQNGKGHLLGHVIDLDYDPTDVNVRTYQTNERQYYHADSCDIVGLMCLRPAKLGGLSSIISSVTLYNEVMARRPDLGALLSQPMAIDRRGEVPSGQKPYFSLAVFNHFAGHVSTYYSRRYTESAQRFDDAPRLTAAHTEAFDLLDELVEDPRLHLQMAFTPGDIQLLHNHTILHDRTAYEDWNDAQRRRHLLRLWLCPPNGRPLAPAYAERWGSIEIGDRGGIRVPGADLKVPLAPE
ncbi:MAG: TauD/TfdA family dioxygenase [Gammaproteobacteria bacterium]|nr:TauD/TfdA family dioxygenase [Gammaproteobacteria bacterium]